MYRHWHRPISRHSRYCRYWVNVRSHPPEKVFLEAPPKRTHGAWVAHQGLPGCGSRFIHELWQVAFNLSMPRVIRVCYAPLFSCYPLFNAGTATRSKALQTRSLWHDRSHTRYGFWSISQSTHKEWRSLPNFLILVQAA